MERIKLSVPSAFLRQRAALGWRELRFGIDNELMAPEAAVEIAAHQVAEQEGPSRELLELAGLARHEDPRELVGRLAEGEPEPDVDEIRSKWLYLVLAWILENRTSYADPLRVIEEVYADFGYPEQVASFVRYMPSTEPDIGSPELNERRLLERWRGYIEDEAKRLAAASRGTRAAKRPRRASEE